MLKVILLDVGGPLVDEDEFYQMSDRLALELLEKGGYEVSEEQYRQALQQIIQGCLPNPRAAALWHFVRPDVARFAELRRDFHTAQREWFLKWEERKLRPGAKEAISKLAERYQLALAGNQLARVKEFLTSEGILDYCQFALVSEEMEAAKPDPLFFQIILDHFTIRPGEAVMVGDRLDSDVFPAKLVGLKTVRVLVGPYAMQEPPTPFHEPDNTIDSIAELPEVVAKLGESAGLR